MKKPFLRCRPISMSQINRKQRNFKRNVLNFSWIKLRLYMRRNISFWYLEYQHFHSQQNMKIFFPTLAASFVGVSCMYMLSQIDSNSCFINFKIIVSNKSSVLYVKLVRCLPKLTCQCYQTGGLSLIIS